MLRFGIFITCFHSTAKTPRPITCILRMTKNISVLHSVSVFQSQGLSHISIVQQKTSLCCAQFQFFNPKACYMFSKYDKKLHFTMLSFSFSIPSPVTYIQWLTNSSIHSNLPCRNHTSNSCGRVLLKGM